MASLYFRYGAMNCGKSSALMQVAYNYNENNMQVLVLKSLVDTKGEEFIVSRIGLKRKVDVIVENEQLFDMNIDFTNIKCILVDEAQFLKEYQVEDLWKITKIYNIPVICYGLKMDFKTELFPGSKRLLELADNIEELITICACGEKARFNARKVNGHFTIEGNQIVIDGAEDNVEYIPLCGTCYLKEVKGITKSLVIKGDRNAK